jgi:hypothetical protein
MFRYAARGFRYAAGIRRNAAVAFHYASADVQALDRGGIAFLIAPGRAPTVRSAQRVKLASPRADAPWRMQHLPTIQPRRPGTAMSNAERQRAFRRRNPGYYGRLHRQRKAEMLAYAAARAAAAEAVVPLAIPAPPTRLMLPAHVQDPAMDALNALAASLKSRAALDPLAVPAQTRAA